MRRVWVTHRRQIEVMFGALQGNAKVIVLTEGVSGIFLQWFNTYLPLYMLALGVSKMQVGFLASALIAMRTLSTLLGAYAADRLGRKRTLVLFDILCWGIPLFLFTIAKNPWYFLVGQLLNGLVYVVLPSFECLFVEDVPRARRTAVFGSLSFLFAAASLFAPVAGWLVAVLGMETGGRVIMAGGLIAILAAAAVRQFTLHETTMGVLRMDATASLGIGALLQEYRATLAQMTADTRVRSFLGVRILVAFSLTIWTTYAAIYLTDTAGLGLAEATISLLPMVTALVTMALILLAARRMRTAWTFSNLSWGFKN
jgi:DHA1 family tetracycline resistance protein-like MFS transporter